MFFISYYDTKATIKKNKLVLLLKISLAVNVVMAAALLAPQTTKLRVAKNAPSITQAPTANSDNLFDEINPEAGFQINASYGSLGPKMISMGVIDPEKFKTTYEKSNQPLTSEQEDILFKGSTEKITITRDNSYFLLNYFWAVGLANKSKILDEGDIIKF